MITANLLAANRIDGTDGNDTVIGSDDDDEIHGLDRDDILIGGRGSDIMYGGTGADKLVIDFLADVPDGMMDFRPDATTTMSYNLRQ